MKNLLNDWKDNILYLSSILNPGKFIIEYKYIDYIYRTLTGYFGIHYFEIETPSIQIGKKYIWIYSLLTNLDKLACFFALYELAYLIDFQETLPKSTQKKLKTLFSNPRQFRNYFFEIYIFSLLKHNNITYIPKPYEGDKELDLTCIIEGNEMLCECRKLYVQDINLIEIQMYFMIKLPELLENLKRRIEFKGKIYFGNFNSNNLKEDVQNKLEHYVSIVNAHKYGIEEFHTKDENCSISIIPNFDNDALTLETNDLNCHLNFTVLANQNLEKPGRDSYGVDLKVNFQIHKYKIYQKLFSAINEKREQHKNSKYLKKIYFIDSEVLPDFEFAIFHLDSMLDDKLINSYIETLTEHEIVCVIWRDYTGEIPVVEIRAYGKNIDPLIKSRLENMDTNFANMHI
ncbi:MAG TPA: hypothetical protein VK590_12390 [Saprospiraceae bacterium]|nr:hypothetical protein [Saprospiraceae bacterium]